MYNIEDCTSKFASFATSLHDNVEEKLESRLSAYLEWLTDMGSLVASTYKNTTYGISLVCKVMAVEISKVMKVHKIEGKAMEPMALSEIEDLCFRWYQISQSNVVELGREDDEAWEVLMSNLVIFQPL